MQCAGKQVVLYNPVISVHGVGLAFQYFLRTSWKALVLAHSWGQVGYCSSQNYVTVIYTRSIAVGYFPYDALRPYSK